MKIYNHIVTQFGVGTSNYLGLDLEDSMVIISVSFFCEVVCISLIWNTTVFESSRANLPLHISHAVSPTTILML